MTRILRKRATILVADDDPNILLSTSTILNRVGYKVLTAQNGEEALRAFEDAQQAIQLVISDVLMPGMKGPQLIHSINSISPSTATLLMSGTPMIRPDTGVASVAKPFTREVLVSKVKDMLGACDFAKIDLEQSAARSQRLAATARVRCDDMKSTDAALPDAIARSDQSQTE